METKEPSRTRRRAILRWAIIAAVGVAAAAGPVVACSGSGAPIDGQGSVGQPPVGSSCGHPSPGCACDTAGQKAACGQQQGGSTTTCLLGTTTCGADLTWGACDPHEVPPVTTQSVAARGHGGVFRGVGPVTLGAPEAVLASTETVPFAMSLDAGCNDPCDPYCSTIADNSNGVDGGPGLGDLDGGWTLVDVPIPPNAIPPCSGNQCFVDFCTDSGTPTTLSGQVLDPAGNYPIANALVMIPNLTVTPMGQGLSYDPCAQANLPQGLGYATTDTSGRFVIGNNVDAGGGSVPNMGYPPTGTGDAGAAVPLLIQVGRWRRLTTVNVPTHCGNNDVGPITLPSVQGGTFGQDNIPHIGVISSACDPFECMLNDIGVDRTQFSPFAGGGRIELLWSYDFNAATSDTVNTGGNLPAAIVMLPDGGFPDPTVSGYDQLLTSQSTLQGYDMVMLPCRCGNEYQNGPNDQNDQNGYRQNLVQYANAGGRVFTSHWGREWIERPNTVYDAGPASACAPPAACPTGAGVTQASCTAAAGCAWTGAGCTGGATCASQTSSGACSPASGCAWSGGCASTGACAAASAQASQAACNGVAGGGCVWSGGGCTSTGACTTAAAMTSQTSCTGVAGGGCAWSGGCSPPAAGTCNNGTNNGSQPACTGTAGCAFTGGCRPPAAATCSTSVNNASTSSCTGTAGCAMTGGCNPPSNCGTATTSASCGGLAGCGWTGCAPPSTACAANGGSQSACTGTAGCAFSGGCANNCAAYNGNKTACTAAGPLCAWNNGSKTCALSGADSCTSNTTSAACTGSCVWSGACAASAAATTTCPAAPDSATCNTAGLNCQWQGCTVSSSAAINCPSKGSQFICIGAPDGCSWNGACVVSSASTSTCPTETTANACGSANLGCSWSGSCAVSSSATSTCPTEATSAACSGAGLGCRWSGSCAQAAACPTGSTATQASCTGADPQCVWTAGSCAQAAACPNTSATTQTSCTAANGQCQWSGGCTTQCPGATSQSACTGITGCSWSGGCTTTCTGTTASSCTAAAGCVWSDAGATWIPQGWVPFPGVVAWDNDNSLNGGNIPLGYPDSTFARGLAFTQWLSGTSGGTGIPWTITDPRYDVKYVIPPTVRFAYSSYLAGTDAATPYDAGGPNSVVDFTFDTPLEAGTQRGRVMYTDMHLSESAQVATPPTVTLGGTDVPIFNTSYTALGGAHECLLPSAGLNMQERVAEYLFFDLGACGAQGLPPRPVPPHWYSSETFTRDYCVAPSSGGSNGGCPTTCASPNQAVVWRNLSWSSIIPGMPDGGAWGGSGGPSIQFYATTAGTQAALGTSPDAGGPVTYLVANDTTTGSYQYDVSQSILPDKSATWLRITMVLNPDQSNQIAPILTSWQQVYDCVNSQ